MNEEQFKELLQKLAELINILQDVEKSLNYIGNRIEDIGAYL